MKTINLAVDKGDPLSRTVLSEEFLKQDWVSIGAHVQAIMEHIPEEWLRKSRLELCVMLAIRERRLYELEHKPSMAEGELEEERQVLERASKADMAHVADEVNSDALIAFILDKEDRLTVTKALRQCNRQRMLGPLLKKIYEDEILQYEQMHRKAFRQAIVPLLGFEYTEEKLIPLIQDWVK